MGVLSERGLKVLALYLLSGETSWYEKLFLLAVFSFYNSYLHFFLF